ncbi:MAG TPA: nucleotidyltransferase family protein [Gemmatimonadales bacterium]|nr:nucleotidyltransferase family protein [Gemmatimonadales bacterium]
MKVAALLLAAGRGTRFGGPKLQASLRGTPMLGHVAATINSAILTGALDRCTAVTAAGDSAIRQLVVDRGFDAVENDNPAAGISGSIRCGLDALAPDAGIGAALIVLGDQPLLRLEVVTALVDRWRQTRKSTRPRYAASPEEPGHPVLLDRSLWRLAERLSGDAGLRGILPVDQIEVVDVEGRNPDVDTSEDLLSL